MFRVQALSPDDYRRVMKIVEEAILSTDLAMYFDKYKKFADYVENGEFDWQNEDKKECKSLSFSKSFTLPRTLSLCHPFTHSRPFFSCLRFVALDKKKMCEHVVQTRKTKTEKVGEYAKEGMRVVHFFIRFIM